MNDDSLATLITKDGRKVLTCEYDQDPVEPDLADSYTEVHLINGNDSFKNIVVKTCFDGDYDKYEKATDDAKSTEEYFKRLQKALDGKMWIVPISKYEHSAIEYSIGISESWDSGVTGFAIYKISEAIDRFGHTEWDNKDQWLEQCVESYLEDYTAYANGNVYVISYRDAETDEVEESARSCIFDDSESMAENMLYFAEIADAEYRDPKDWVEAKQETIVTHKYTAI